MEVSIPIEMESSVQQNAGPTNSEERREDAADSISDETGSNGGTPCPATEPEDQIPVFRPFGKGLLEDLQVKLPWYWSDLKDGFDMKAFITVLYLFWGALANAVAFGALLGDKTEGYMGATETLLATAALGMMYPLLCGQPLTIMGATGPIAAYILALRSLGNVVGVKFLPLYAWSGIFLSMFLFLASMFSLSNAIKKVTRFTEELFSVLISVIFIYQALSYFINLFTDENGVVQSASPASWQL